MPITVADLEAEMVDRARELLVLMSLDTTTTGTNAVLARSLAFGARVVGLSLASPLSVTDSDLESLGDADLDKLLDFAEFRLIESLYARLTKVSTAVGPLARVEWGQLQTKYRDLLERLTKKLAKLYGFQQGTLTAGVITLNIGQAVLPEDAIDAS